MRDKNVHRKRLLALLLFAPLITGCGGSMSDMFSSDLMSKDAEWFSRPGRLFIKNVSIETPPLTPNKPITPDDLVSAEGMCPGMAPPPATWGRQRVDRRGRRRAAPHHHGNGRAGSYRMRRGARHWRARQRQSLQQSARRPGRGGQLFAGPRAGIYTFTAGRLTSIERGPEPVEQPKIAKPKAKKKRPTAS